MQIALEKEETYYKRQIAALQERVEALELEAESAKKRADNVEQAAFGASLEVFLVYCVAMKTYVAAPLQKTGRAITLWLRVAAIMLQLCGCFRKCACSMKKCKSNLK